MNNATADFGRIETCACCGKDVKKPVKFRGAFMGKDCREAIRTARLNISLRGLDAAIEEEKRYHPRSWERIMSFAR